AETSLFFQYGRFFGVSFGAGFETVTGNRGRVWEGGFPLIALKLHYWFDFSFALEMIFQSGSHHFTNATNRSVNATLTQLGVALKSYSDTRDLSDAITFAGPHLLGGIGAYTKSQADPDLGADAVDRDTQLRLQVGVGLELPRGH